jgi:creatinine amidohydrolase/Fe(II)-dependent formamide hydrolase-like protein
MRRTAVFAAALFLAAAGWPRASSVDANPGLLGPSLDGQAQGQAQGQQGRGQGRGRGGGQAADPRDAGGGACRNNPLNCIDTPNPLPAPDTIWLEEMTWMDVRDAMKAGKTTMILAAGGIEPNGPWLALGKHQYVLRANCEAIARRLGNALCAPLIPFVPEGAIEPTGGHMRTVGTISLREETFRALVTDIVHSFKMHGFRQIILISDSGGNVRGMQAVAQQFTDEWKGDPVVAYIPEYYDYASVQAWLREQGVMKEGAASDGLHDDPAIALNMFITDPRSIRWDARVKAGKATIDGVSLADRARSLEIARQIVEFRTSRTVEAIRKRLTSGK